MLPNTSFDDNQKIDRIARIRKLETQAILDAVVFNKKVAESGSLVKIVSIPSALTNTGKNQKKINEKYLLRAVARNLLIDANTMSNRGNKHSTRTCGQHKAFGKESVTIKLNAEDLNSEASIGNTISCNCVWSCPVCYEKIATEKARDIYTAIQWAKANNHACIMIVLTASHSAKMPLSYSKKTFKQAWDMFNSHRQWKKFKKKFGVTHVIQNVDVTFSETNGWHYHKHLLLFVDKEVTNVSAAHDEIDKILTEIWITSLKNNERSATEEHGLYLSTKQNASSEYLAKVGITVKDDGTLHFEMTSTYEKNSRTIWDILRHARHNDKESKKLYLEYVRAFTGDNWISFGRSGLQKIIEEFVPEKTGGKPKNGKKHWLNFGDYWWDIVRWSSGHARIVDVAAKSRSIQNIRDILLLMRWELARDKKLSEYYLRWTPKKHSMHDLRIHDDWKAKQDGTFEADGDNTID